MLLALDKALPSPSKLFFGHDENECVQGRLNLRSTISKPWCKAKKIYCSQPRFRAFMASRLALYLGKFCDYVHCGSFVMLCFVFDL